MFCFFLFFYLDQSAANVPLTASSDFRISYLSLPKSETDGGRLPRFMEVKERGCMRRGEYIAGEITKISTQRCPLLGFLVMLF